LAINDSLRRFAGRFIFREELHRPGRARRRYIRVMFLGMEAVHLDLRILAHVVFLAGTNEEKRDTAGQ
jgi:hypothetical protein